MSGRSARFVERLFYDFAKKREQECFPTHFSDDKTTRTVQQL